MERSKGPVAAHTEGDYLRKHPFSRSRKRSYFLNIIIDLIRDIAALATGTGSALIIQRYDPLHNHLSKSLDRTSNEGISAEQHLQKIFAHLKWLWREAASTLNRPQEVEKLGTCHRLTVLSYGLYSQHIHADKFLQSKISNFLPDIHVPEPLSDPSPLLFLAACIIFAFSIAAVRYSHRADRHQDRILILGVLSGILAACFQNENFLMVLKGYLARFTILALLVSALAHRALRLWNGLQIVDEETNVAVQAEKGEKS
jgi:hypothetical protein